MDNKPNLATSLARMEALESKLKALGVPVDALGQVMGHIDEYSDLKDGLEKARANQFADDAYDFLQSIKQVSTRNTEALSSFLRRFAEHVIRETMNRADPTTTNDLESILDHMPQLCNAESEDDDE